MIDGSYSGMSRAGSLGGRMPPGGQLEDSSHSTISGSNRSETECTDHHLESSAWTGSAVSTTNGLPHSWPSQRCLLDVHDVVEDIPEGEMHEDPHCRHFTRGRSSQGTVPRLELARNPQLWTQAALMSNDRIGSVTTVPCPECGVHVSVDANVCPECGHLLAKTLSAATIILLVVVLGLAVATAIWFARVGFSDLDLGF